MTDHPTSQTKDARNKKAGSSTGTLVLLGVVSLIYVGGMTWALGGVQSCPAVPEDLAWLETQRARFLSCLPVNALGDFLAGLFAPLAFLWLAGTVFIQSRELRAQRAELELTRMVMTEQVGETRASRELFDAQTSILRKELELKELNEFDKEMEAILDGLVEARERMGWIAVHTRRKGDASRLTKELVSGHIDRRAPSLFEALLNAGHRYRQLNGRKLANIELEFARAGHLPHFRAMMQQYLSFDKPLSRQLTTQLDAMRAREAIEEFQAVLDDVNRLRIKLGLETRW